MLSKALPASSKLPLYEYGSKGTFEYFNAMFKPLISYNELKGEVGQIFREIGNTILLVKCLQDSMHVAEIMDISFKSAYLDPQGELKLSFKNVMKEAHEVLFQEDTNRVNQEINFQTLCNISETIIDFYNSQNEMSLVKMVLKRLQSILQATRSNWEGAPTPNSDVFSIDQSTEFYRIWIVFHFVMCFNSGGQEKALRELFGDGLHWAGCAFMVLLNQRERYEMFDITQHLLCVNSVEKKEPQNPKEKDQQNNTELSEFLENARYNVLLQKQVFDMIEIALSKQ